MKHKKFIFACVILGLLLIVGFYLDFTSGPTTQTIGAIENLQKESSQVIYYDAEKFYDEGIVRRIG